MTTPTPTASAVTGADQAAIVSTTGTAGGWRLHPAGSEVGFDVKKFWGLVTVHGTFSDVDGVATVLPDGAIGGTLTIRTASLDTGQAKRDDHLRGGDFFDADRFPEATVRVDRVELSSPTVGRAHGQVTVLGESRPLAFDVAVSLGGDARTALVSGQATIDRSQFGMDWSPLRMAAFDAVVSFRLEFRADAA